MPFYKKLLITMILLSMLAISLFTMILDFSRFFPCSPLYDRFPSEYWKRVNVLFAALLVWTAGKSQLSRRDSKLMKLAFLLILLGEIGFLYGKPIIAIGVFAVVQLLLIHRHTKGLCMKLKKGSLQQKLKLLGCGSVLASLLLAALHRLQPYSKSTALTFMGTLYGIILCISLWTGIAVPILKSYPQKNAVMISLGMLCFFCCDVLVGLDGLFRTGQLGLIASSCIWIFYTPAVTLLALSTYDYRSHSYSAATIANT